MNIICIGGAGYIGSIVTDELIEAGHKVVVMDELVKGRLTSPLHTSWLSKEARR